MGKGKAPKGKKVLKKVTAAASPKTRMSRVSSSASSRSTGSSSSASHRDESDESDDVNQISNDTNQGEFPFNNATIEIGKFVGITKARNSMLSYDPRDIVINNSVTTHFPAKFQITHNETASYGTTFIHLLVQVEEIKNCVTDFAQMNGYTFVPMPSYNEGYSGCLSYPWRTTTSDPLSVILIQRDRIPIGQVNIHQVIEGLTQTDKAHDVIVKGRFVARVCVERKDVRLLIKFEEIRAYKNWLIKLNLWVAILMTQSPSSHLHNPEKYTMKYDV